LQDQGIISKAEIGLIEVRLQYDLMSYFRKPSSVIFESDGAEWNIQQAIILM
jgi:hypothetical protein